MKQSDIQAKEKLHFQKLASFSTDHIREKNEKPSFWMPYKEDVERIIHSKAFKRYSDKTQVVYLMDNDHLTHRGHHVQLVSSFARGVASLLGLNIDLVEAISLGHDVGHPPFGHEGEGYLSKICQDANLGAYSHSSQSCRLFRLIEPLNLGFLVYDGFLCHDGGMKKPIAKPKKDKTLQDHFEEVQSRKKEPEKDLSPASLEGCLVKMCDSVSYLAKDLEDAIQLGIIKRTDIPKTLLGRHNHTIVQKAANDLVEVSYNQPFIGFTDEVFESLKALRKFNFERIYTYPGLKIQSLKIKKAYEILFELVLDDFIKNKNKSHLYMNFLHSKSECYIEETPDLLKVVDYIAGMTDRYFVSCIEKFVIPQTIVL